MTQKKEKPPIPADMWLHVATDALGRYADGENDVVAFMAEDNDGNAGLCLFLLGVTMDDPRLAPALVSKAIMIDATQEAQL